MDSTLIAPYPQSKKCWFPGLVCLAEWTSCPFLPWSESTCILIINLSYHQFEQHQRRSECHMKISQNQMAAPFHCQWNFVNVLILMAEEHSMRIQNLTQGKCGKIIHIQPAKGHKTSPISCNQREKYWSIYLKPYWKDVKIYRGPPRPPKFHHHYSQFPTFPAGPLSQWPIETRVPICHIAGLLARMDPNAMACNHRRQ